MTELYYDPFKDEFISKKDYSDMTVAAAMCDKYPELIGQAKIGEHYKEGRYIIDFILGMPYWDAVLEDQLMCLWTAYCLHWSFDVDTAPYDNCMLDIWMALHSNVRTTKYLPTYESFYNRMSRFLV